MPNIPLFYLASALILTTIIIVVIVRSKSGNRINNRNGIIIGNIDNSSHITKTNVSNIYIMSGQPTAPGIKKNPFAKAADFLLDTTNNIIESLRSNSSSNAFTQGVLVVIESIFFMATATLLTPPFALLTCLISLMAFIYYSYIGIKNKQISLMLYFQQLLNLVLMLIVLFPMTVYGQNIGVNYWHLLQHPSSQELTMIISNQFSFVAKLVSHYKANPFDAITAFIYIATETLSVSLSLISSLRLIGERQNINQKSTLKKLIGFLIAAFILTFLPDITTLISSYLLAK